MKKKKFMPRSFIETLELLCFAKGGEFLLAGRINQTHIARIAGTSQSNVHRWMGGEYEPKVAQLRLLCEAFGTNVSQLLGEAPINRIDLSDELSKEDQEFMEAYAKMPDTVKKMVRDTATGAINLLETKS